MTPGSVDGIQSPSSSPPSSPPSAHEADMDYQERKSGPKGEQHGPLMQLERYLNVTQVCCPSCSCESKDRNNR